MDELSKGLRDFLSTLSNHRVEEVKTLSICVDLGTFINFPNRNLFTEHRMRIEFTASVGNCK
jgi:hypothetical protein